MSRRLTSPQPDGSSPVQDKNPEMQVTRASEYAMLGLLALTRRGPAEVAMLDVIAREEDVM